MADDTHASAIDSVARHVLATAVDFDSVAWADYPDLDEHDWHVVLAHADVLAQELWPDGDWYDAGYDHLAYRGTRRPV